MESRHRPLSGRIAVVTGATSGIGEAIVIRLAEAGAKVVALGRNESSLKGLLGTGSRSALNISALRVDLSDEADLRHLASQVGQKFDGIDLLVHSAGVFARGKVESADIADLDRLMNLNVRAPYLLTQLLLPSLYDRRGHIVFINSIAALQSRAGVSQYSASKSALRAIADALRDEVHASGIRVTTVFPGRTATSMQEEVCRLEGMTYRPDQFMPPEDLARLLLGILLLPQSAEVTEVIVRPMRRESETSRARRSHYRDPGGVTS